MRKDVLEPDEPQHGLFVGLLVDGVTDDVEFDDAPTLLKTGRLVSRRVRMENNGLEKIKQNTI